jgi:hypothetical protein
MGLRETGEVWSDCHGKAGITHPYRCLSSGLDEAVVTRSTFAARSRATCCSITVRVSGVGGEIPLQRSNLPTHRDHDFKVFGIAWQYRWGGGY